MSGRLSALPWLCMLALFTSCFPVLAQPEDQAGWIRLDNGKDLSGWYPATWTGRETGDWRGWSVVDGAIHLDSAEAHSHLFHRRMFGRDVVIRLEFRAGYRADSGLNLHGKQFQVRDYPNVGPSKYAFAAKPHGQWNELEFDVTDGVARVFLNGQLIEKAWRLGDNPRLGLGLQSEVGTFDFRNIRIKQKTPSRELDVRVSECGTAADGKRLQLFTLTNERGLEVRVLNYGATLVGVDVPDRSGRRDNVTLFFESCQRYLGPHPLFGSVVGRYANRIAGARLVLDGVEYQLEANAGRDHIHGGRRGFQRRFWDAQPLRQPDRVGVRLSLLSPDGDAGYPGNLRVTVTYWLNQKNELTLDYEATTDKPTVVNLTNHAYWNLAGAGQGDVLDHILWLNADRVLESDRRHFPTGRILPVRGTAFDFTKPHPIGLHIDQVPGGYDHCFVLKKESGQRYSLAARLVDPKTGRGMEVWTTQPGVQLYTANGLRGDLGAKGRTYVRYGAVCLETQHFPDSPNHPNFPSTVLRPGQTYHEWTVHRFFVER